MRRFWEFRSNIKQLEYYHKYKDLKTFKEKCHDYYMLLPLWFLEKNYFDEVIIWRLTKEPKKDIVFYINGKKYIQRWIKHFSETFSYPSPEISFWRGGFREYDEVTKLRPNHFGKKIYLGAGRRIFSQWGGKYDAYLVEDERDVDINKKCYPFYKTASSNIFHPYYNTIVNMYWDICWPCNFTQVRYKGQEYFIKLIAQHTILQRLKIVHCGNQPHIGKHMCKKYGVDNIEFLGSVDRLEFNKVLNSSRVALNTSNLNDGCPRISTEILMSETPLIYRDTVRLLDYYKHHGAVEINEDNVVDKLVYAIENYVSLRGEISRAIKNELSFDTINQMNINRWKKI